MDCHKRRRKSAFTTQSLGLNPEVLSKDEILSRLDDKFDISQNKDKATHLFFYGAGCGTDRMKNFLSEVFQAYFSNAEISVYEDTYAAVLLQHQKMKKTIVCILGTGSNCSYFDGNVLHQKYNLWAILLWTMPVVIALEDICLELIILIKCLNSLHNNLKRNLI